MSIFNRFEVWGACFPVPGSVGGSAFPYRGESFSRTFWGSCFPVPGGMITRAFRVRWSLGFKIIFQDFGKIILKNNLEKKSRLFFKILAKIFLNKIIDFTIYLYGGAKRPPIIRS